MINGEPVWTEWRTAVYCYEIHLKLKWRALKHDGWPFDHFECALLLIFLNEILVEGLWRIWGGHSMHIKHSVCLSVLEKKYKKTNLKWNFFFCYYSVSILRFMIPSLFIISVFCRRHCLAICHVPPLPYSHTPVKTKYQSEVKGTTWGLPLQPIMESLKLGFDSGFSSSSSFSSSTATD